MSLHTCDAIVICCIDFRFQKYIRNWTDINLADKTFDLVGFAGVTKDLPIVLNQIDISVRLHHISEVDIIHHEECGAYGAESTPEKHVDELHKAYQQIHTKYPDLTINLFYLKLDGTFVSVNP